ncbi:MAG: 4'-phosphopantetheinyl transferase superfamily protein [Synergistaceae bacterium]|nr:4'-phosphopantetheinyl transferase superfamily protein [Synergistaceae bacterium]
MRIPPAKICVYILIARDSSEQAPSNRLILRCADHFLSREARQGPAPPGKKPKPYFEIVRAEGMKPFFAPDVGLHFSVSHSGKYWVCALSSQAVGIDIQSRVCEYERGIATRYFHPDEHEYLTRVGYSDFFRIWTAKESYVKYTGEGINDNFQTFSSVIGNCITDTINGAQIRFLPVDADYDLCLCAAQIEKTQMIFLDNAFMEYEKTCP